MPRDYLRPAFSGVIVALSNNAKRCIEGNP